MSVCFRSSLCISQKPDSETETTPDLRSPVLSLSGLQDVYFSQTKPRMFCNDSPHAEVCSMTPRVRLKAGRAVGRWEFEKL